MKTIEHDIVHAFVIFFGMIALFFCTQYFWMITPGEIILREEEKETGVSLSDLSEEDRAFVEQIYEQGSGKSIWMTARFPYLWDFKLLYPIVVLFAFGFVALVRGFGLAKPRWKWVLASVSLPYSILFLTLILELVRGSEPLKGMWLCILGGGAIVFGTYKTKSKPEPAGAINDEAAASPR